MKHPILSSLFLVLTCVTTSFGQSPSFETPTNYIGIGTGVNATGLLGLTYEHIFKEHIGVYANVGTGGWGYKLGVGGRLYFKNAYSGAIGLNISHAMGQSGLVMPLHVVQNGQSVQKDVTIDQHPVEVLNLSYLKFWKMGKKARFNLEAGYSIPLDGKTSDNYTVVTPGITLDQASKNSLNGSQPGGLILAVGFTFGF
jgi:hypothetical protein